MREQDIIDHPILYHQNKLAKMVLTYWHNIFDLLIKKRDDVIQPLIIDMIIKLFRMHICNNKSCHECSVCNPNRFMNTTAFINFISANRDTIIHSIEQGFNNSFNVPQRGMTIQYIIDQLFDPDESIIAFEIGCGWWMIGKILTNSNISKEVFRQQPFNWNLEKDRRFVQYYWIDPNLITDKKNILNMINGNSKEMQVCRDITRFINSDERFFDSYVKMDQTYLNDDTIEAIWNTLSDIVNNCAKSTKKNLIIITSLMRYYNKTIQKNNDLDRMILTLWDRLYNSSTLDTIHYISNDVYGKNGRYYPAEADDYNQLLVKDSKIINWSFVYEHLYSELTTKFSNK